MAVESREDRYTVYEVIVPCPECGHLPENRETRRWRAKKGRQCVCGGKGEILKYVPSHQMGDTSGAAEANSFDSSPEGDWVDG